MYIFTISAGRTGTAFLAELLARNLDLKAAHHERLHTEDIGRHTPDIGTMRRFNDFGFDREVQTFWFKKIGHIMAVNGSYVETNHQLAKGGLIEGLNAFGAFSPILRKTRMIVLHRDWGQTLLSYRRRMDFSNKALWWWWFLDPEYKRNLVDSAAYKGCGLPDWIPLWYLAEMRARTRKYKTDYPNLNFHDVWLEDIVTEEGARGLLSYLIGTEYTDDIDLPGVVNGGVQNILFPDQKRVMEIARAHMKEEEEKDRKVG